MSPFCCSVFSASPPDSLPIAFCIISVSFTPSIYERPQVNGIWLIRLAWFPIALLYRWARAAQISTTDLSNSPLHERNCAPWAAQRSNVCKWQFILGLHRHHLSQLHCVFAWNCCRRLFSVTLSKCQEWFEYPNLPIDIGSNAHKLLALEESKRRMETCRWIYQWHWS